MRWRVGLGGLLLWCTAASADEGSLPLYQQMVETAEALAREPYRRPEAALPESLQELDYEGYRDIRFRKSRALWSGAGGYSVELFHPGFLYDEPVTIREVVDGEVRPVPFDPAMFDYGRHGVPEALPESLGFAGFRLHYPMHDPGYADEIVAFLGASYFRMVGRDQQYGLSARGLAIDTALPSGEEFPRFTEFWLVRPPAGSSRIELFALLDSESVTGAYAFVLESGADTEFQVQARLFARKDVQRLGVAPLTSMFAWGENSVRRFDDYRPEVHDSDGLLHHTAAGEWIWRPLENPPSLRVSTLLDRDLAGFGLIQRDRRFDNYQDPEARYEVRPSLWIEPTGGDWGAGAVHLVEIPTPDETNDNVVAYWVDDRPFRAGEQRHYQYRLRTAAQVGNADDLAVVTATRNGWGWIPGASRKPSPRLRQFTVDFAGGQLRGLRAGQPVSAELEAGGATVRDLTVARLPDDQGWRAAFKLDPGDRDGAVNLRLHLELGERRISETWNYVWSPETVQES